MAEFGESRRVGNKLKGVAAVGTLAGLVTAAGMLESSEGAKPNPSEVYEGTVKITRQVTNDATGKITEARIREWPDIPHGSSAAPNTYNGWPWSKNEIFIKNPQIVESYDPANGDPTGGIWIQFPVDGDQKFIAWSPANAGVVEALPGGKFVQGNTNPDGSFEGDQEIDFKPDELSVVSFEPPAQNPQK